MVCKIAMEDSNEILKHGQWFEAGRQYSISRQVVGIGGFSFLFFLLILLNSNA
jgi:uncharacterized membrane protein YhfC